MQLVRHETHTEVVPVHHVGVDDAPLGMHFERVTSTRIWVWFAWEELVQLFEPRSAVDVREYIHALAFLDERHEVCVEHDVARRGYMISGTLDAARAVIDTTIMAILPRGDAPVKATGVPAVEPDNLQPVARQPRRVLHI